MKWRDSGEKLAQRKAKPSRDKVVKVTHRENGRTICPQARVAGTFLTRLVGLLGARTLATDAGLWIIPSSSVHTIGMRFSIDVVLVDAAFRIVALYANVAPGRVVGLRRCSAASALELPSGSIFSCGLNVNEYLDMRPVRHGENN